MNQEIVLRHEFVEFIPEVLKEGTVYISICFGTVSHLCACGCKNKVVTPLRPTDWKLIFDGKAITLYPSIGNWSFPCQSHYWIKNSRVEWEEQWSRARIDAGRAHDRWAKERYLCGHATAEPVPMSAREPETAKLSSARAEFWRKVRRLLWR